ncbi:Hypothetical predicted protein [Cloeon dipterum]|uniref:Uncharacterized protein n=1 Tax=Cloeon dipterum TaxID=197152 RepID=A0A8S1D9U9_9INSE|nr:Hypothetical predicted protein [Cloeon dipterum]
MMTTLAPCYPNVIHTAVLSGPEHSDTEAQKIQRPFLLVALLYHGHPQVVARTLREESVYRQEEKELGALGRVHEDTH